jgi:zinc D-Ala-D-Ala carboxypeptidase
MTTTFHRHWRDVPGSAWRWPNFSPAEIACRGTGKLLINEPALDKLQALRDRLGKPLIVRSAYRSPEHNRAVGGAPRSKHLDGAAFDIAMGNHDPVAFEAEARAVGFLGFGFYPRSGFMHIDLGPARQWGERFPVRATAFAAETPLAREVLADSRTMKGGGAAGVATLGAAGARWRRASWPRLKPPSCCSCRISTRSVGCSSPSLSGGSRSPSMLASMTGGGGGDDRHLARRDCRQPVDPGGFALRRHHARGALVPAFASAVRRASGTAG